MRCWELRMLVLRLRAQTSNRLNLIVVTHAKGKEDATIELLLGKEKKMASKI